MYTHTQTRKGYKYSYSCYETAAFKVKRLCSLLILFLPSSIAMERTREPCPCSSLAFSLRRETEGKETLARSLFSFLSALLFLPPWQSGWKKVLAESRLVVWALIDLSPLLLFSPHFLRSSPAVTPLQVPTSVKSLCAIPGIHATMLQYQVD